jgi:putative OPT family oligopeptide transporter
MFGGELPWDMIGIGGIIGAVIIAFDSWLKARGSHFRMPVLAAAIGIYLPLELMVPIFLGGLIAHLVEKKLGVSPHDELERDRIHRPGTLFSAGLITGEALMGIFIAIPIVASGRADVLSLPEGLLPGEIGKLLLGVAILVLVAWMMFRSATRRAD